MTTLATKRPEDLSDEDRREFIQQSARSFYRRKMAYSKLFIGVMGLGLVVAFVPLFSIIESVLSKGIPYISWKFLTTTQQQPDLFHQHRLGGISNALTGTALVFGLGFAIAMPIAVVVAIALYESHGRVMNGFRLLLEVMVGMPSILFGIFILVYVVQRMHFQLTGLAGSLALAILMLPLMTVTCEQALRSVPSTYVEAALALGAKKSKVMRRVVLPYARPRMLTGIMLSASRGVGETAPVLFVIGASMLVNMSPMSQQTTTSTLMYNNLLYSIYGPQRTEVWGIALVLITVVLVLNVSSRLIVARINKGRT